MPLWIVVDGYPEGQFKLQVSVEAYANESESCSDVGFDEIPTLPLCSPGLDCVGNVCVDPTCGSTSNGFCDEPEGTGLCLDGTDTADCEPCPPKSAFNASGVCVCDSGYEMIGGTCEPMVCDFMTSCPGTTDCTWNFTHDELRCSDLEGQANIGETCMDEDFIDPYWGCAVATLPAASASAPSSLGVPTAIANSERNDNMGSVGKSLFPSIRLPHACAAGPRRMHLQVIFIEGCGGEGVIIPHDNNNSIGIAEQVASIDGSMSGARKAQL